MDSQVRFFEMMGGSFREIVYDNMRNVVTKFIGKGEKELNPELIKMAAYYGFRINVTNCFSGNEKGYVESTSALLQPPPCGCHSKPKSSPRVRSVKILRNKFFSGHYIFASLDEAREYLHSQLLKHNEGSLMEEEKKYLLPYKPPLELAEISEHTVNSGCMICVRTRCEDVEFQRSQQEAAASIST